MFTITELLLEAAEKGLTVTIVYNGGSKPGASRPIIPVRVVGNAVRAREPGLPRDKTLSLDKIARVTTGDGRSSQPNEVLPIETPAPAKRATMDEYAERLKPEYVRRGWNVFFDPAQQFFGVGRYFKSGKAMKTSVVSLQFVDRSEVPTADWDTGEIVMLKKELTGRERPWLVYSERREQGRSFADLSLAFEFLSTEVDASTAQRT